jgi:hypothetical protein
MVLGALWRFVAARAGGKGPPGEALFHKTKKQVQALKYACQGRYCSCSIKPLQA